MNGLLTRIKNGYFRAVMIHMPVKKKDIRENRYHAHIRNLVSWTRQAHENEFLFYGLVHLATHGTNLEFAICKAN